MKKLIYTLCLFTGMAISSCEDWLARDPLDQIADVNLTYTADECKLYVNQFYIDADSAGKAIKVNIFDAIKRIYGLSLVDLYLILGLA